MTEKSLIICNTFTKKGYKTFTYRWNDDEQVGWKDIFKFISQKTGFAANYYTVNINGIRRKYDELFELCDFDFDNFVYYEKDGRKTSNGVINLGINLGTFVHNNVILQW